jgi:hypothetical protein
MVSGAFRDQKLQNPAISCHLLPSARRKAVT